MSDTLPHDLEAERAILGACLVSPNAIGTARATLSLDDWYAPRHELIWAAIAELTAEGEPADAITVAERLNRTGVLGRSGGRDYLHQLIAGTFTAANVGYHAEIVVKAAVRRRMVAAGQTLIQRAIDSEADDLETVLRAARTELDLLDAMRHTGARVPGTHTWGEFIAAYAGRPGNWIVPGAIGRKDVWMILAPAGAGKTTLSRQMCWSIAAGVHPWDHLRHIAPARTLLIDLENDEGMAADESAEFYARYDALAQGELEQRALVWSYPQGLDIRKAADEFLLDDVITWAKPDFIAFGSLYKSFSRTGDWDQCANEARAVFDRLRARHQVTFWLEHHMPKAQDGGRKQTPFGSSVWEWWASHGRVLERAVADNRASPFTFAAPFRGDRGRRECPVGFTRGGPYPWTAVMDQGELDALVEACS